MSNAALTLNPTLYSTQPTSDCIILISLVNTFIPPSSYHLSNPQSTF